MMNNTSKKPCNFQTGTSIRGKWHGKSYTIKRELGFGANGIVYLAEGEGGTVALKFSDNSASIAAEVNVLTSLSKVQGSILGPSLIDVDDYQRQGTILPFYVMEYIQGDNFLRFVADRGPDWIGVLTLQLLSNLEELHKLGWVFGDLKPENIIVQVPRHQIRCIDVGGTTQIGRAIKEYTEFFDRGYWGMGGRKADPQYDLFAVAMIMINAGCQNRFSKNNEGFAQLKKLINNNKILRKYQTVLHKALLGKYDGAEAMKRDLVPIIHRSGNSVSQTSGSKKTTSPKSRVKNRQAIAQKKSAGLWETIVLAIIVSMLYALYLFNQVV